MATVSCLRCLNHSAVSLLTLVPMKMPPPKTYQLYKRNLLKYATSGYLCKGVFSKVRALTYLFGIEHLTESSSHELLVSPELCTSMVRTRRSPAGPLRRTAEGVLRTQNVLNWHQPSWTASECCRWWQWEVSNYFAIPVTVYSRHGQIDFECTGADVSRCPSYTVGYCQLDKQGLIWNVAPKQGCQFLPADLLEGHGTSTTWLSSNGQLALTHSNETFIRDCNKTLQMSDQQIAFLEVPTKSRSARASELDEGVVLSDQLASQQQALYLRLRQQIHFLYRHNLQSVL